MRDVVLVAATFLVAAGLLLVLRFEFTDAAARRKVGPARDTVEVLLPALAMAALVWWVWIS
jgi:hypothetical protein